MTLSLLSWNFSLLKWKTFLFSVKLNHFTQPFETLQGKLQSFKTSKWGNIMWCHEYSSILSVRHNKSNSSAPSANIKTTTHKKVTWIHWPLHLTSLIFFLITAQRSSVTWIWLSHSSCHVVVMNDWKLTNTRNLMG